MALESFVIVPSAVGFEVDREPFSVVDALPDRRILTAIFVLGPVVDDHKVCGAPALAVSGLQLEVQALHQQRTVAVRNKNVL